MNIALNTLSARAGAGISVFQMLMKAIHEIDRKNKYFVFVSSKQTSIIESIPDNFERVIFKHCPANPYFRVLWEQFILPFYMYKYKIDVLYSVGNTTVLLAPCKVVLFIENVNPFSKIIKNWTIKGKIRNKLLFYLGWLSAKKAKKIRFCSERAMEIIKKIYKIEEQKCFLLRHGLDLSSIKTNGESRLPFNYILTVSVVAPHKNMDVLIKAFAILKTNNLYNGKLIIVGNTDCYPDYYNKLVNIINKLKIQDDVILYGSIKYNEIFDFYKNADCFVFPSLEETFGLPVIESLYFNVPTILSDGLKHKHLFIPFNEIARNYAIYFDPYDEHDLADKIIQNINNKQEIDSKKFVENYYNIKEVAKILVKEFNNLK
ncbi:MULTISPECIES: glycosyltransferase family 4 protein [Thermodesulfovibrio]|uniref:glycosyltransferase family 4 protein n=1 Tax=Thermodesulfovibrio yellowstonii TaxID=28262 RepID=UPI0004092F39|nr:glycosyltransferase family 1 protein [Thermodesulfovibrio islandicus]